MGLSCIDGQVIRIELQAKTHDPIIYGHQARVWRLTAAAAAVFGGTDRRRQVPRRCPGSEDGVIELPPLLPS
jgi:hypothetical protein